MRMLIRGTSRHDMRRLITWAAERTRVSLCGGDVQGPADEGESLVGRETQPRGDVTDPVTEPSLPDSWHAGDRAMEVFCQHVRHLLILSLCSGSDLIG